MKCNLLANDRQVLIYVRGDTMNEKLKITKRSNLKGEDGYKVFSIRIKDELYERLEELSVQTNRSRNELINLMLEFGLERCEVTDDGNKK